jgi:hypothetical protein
LHPWMNCQQAPPLKSSLINVIPPSDSILRSV